MATQTVQRIDTQAFDAAVQAMEAAQRALGSARNTMQNSTRQLLQTWEGFGKEAFETVYGRLNTRLGDEEENLAAIRESLLAIKQSYANWDTGSAGGMRKEGR